ncbi:MAG: NAD-dependent epimerase/dehydratase family protein, partial [Bacteroidota bacterium]
MKKIVITGGTGFIGKSLAHHLQAHGYQPIVVARNRPKADLPFEFAQWDALHPGEWSKQLEGALAVINLAGRTVDCIKTPENCDVILRSRVDSTKAVGQALKQAENPPKIWIQMSTAHIYGDPPSQICTEESSYGYGLAPFVAMAWEKAHEEHLPEGTRSVLLRTSFVVGNNGGALATLKFISRLGLGGKVGHGKQGISWIHEWDMNEIIRQAIEAEQFDKLFR